LRLHDVRISRTGDMTYSAGQTPVPVGPGGVAVITRDESVVFDAEALASWVGKPVTIGHPPATVTADTWSDLARGHIENARRGSPPYADFMVGDVLVTHPEAIKLADAGCEISGGYDAAYAADGVGRGRQTKIVGNHLAFLPDGIKGRCGELCYVGDQSMDVEEPKMTDKTKLFGSALLRRLVGAKDEAEMSTVLDEAIAAEHAAEVATLTGQVTTLTAENVRLTAALDAAEKKGDDHTHKFGDDGKCSCGMKKGDDSTMDAAAVQDLHARTVTVADLMALKNNTTLVDLMKAGLEMNPMQDQFESIRAADERSRKKWVRPAAAA
jgi:hypothetical protein